MHMYMYMCIDILHVPFIYVYMQRWIGIYCAAKDIQTEHAQEITKTGRE